MTTVLVLLVCLSSVVRAYGPNDESSVAGMVKAMAKQITTLTAALEARQMDRKHIQLTTGGEVVELVRIADVKALTEQMEAYERKMDAQDARLAAQELARITELDATTAKLAVQEARISELSATVAQLLATGARPMPVDADKTLETTAARRLREAGSPPPSPSQPPPSPSPPPPPAWPPLPAKANELSISGRHTAISFNTNVHGVDPFRCTGVADGKLTCSGELKAADFRTASGISLEELAQFAGMVPPAAPPPPPPSPSPPSPSPSPPPPPTPSTWVPFSADPNSNQEYCSGGQWDCSISNSNYGFEAPVGGTDEASCLNFCSGYRFCSFDFGTYRGSRCCARANSCSSSIISRDDRAYRIYESPSIG